MSETATETTAAPGLVVRLRADRTDEDALAADLPGAPAGQWPLAGLEIVGEPPARCTVNTTFVDKLRSRGVLTVEDEQVVVRPGGPPDDRMRRDSLHVFTHGSALVLHTTDGDVRYRVVRNPDKFVGDGGPDDPVTDEHYESGNTRVEHTYELELEG